MKKQIYLVIFAIVFLALATDIFAKEKMPEVKKVKKEEAKILLDQAYPCPEYENCEFWSSNFKVFKVDLNNDQIEEVIVREAFCSGNDCKFFIFGKKEKEGYEKIFEVSIGVNLNYFILKEKTNGYYDLQVEKWTPTPSYAGGIYTNTYIWNGKDYEMKVPK